MKVPGRSVLCLAALSLAGGLAPLQAQTNLAVLANDGAWTWFNDPRALFNDGTLYFAYNRFADGLSVLSTLNLQTGGVTNLWTSSLAAQDDHYVAGLLPKQDGTMLAVYSRHGKTSFSAAAFPPAPIRFPPRLGAGNKETTPATMSLPA